jgi:hypothetical protein
VERAVTPNPVAIYLGCVGLIVGSLGLVLQPPAAGSKATTPLFVQTGLAMPQAGPRWPLESEPGPVAFHDEMIQILAPVRAEEPATVPEVATAPEPRKEAARETVKEKKAKVKSARVRKRDNTVVVDDEEARGSGGYRYRIERQPEAVGYAGEGVRIFGPFELR